jgi:two-component system chemotaxis response regulator CheY
MRATILIIDDSAAQRKVIRLALETQGYVVVEAENGFDGLQKITDATDLIFCDVNMPIMDGLEFLRSFKASPDYPDIPIIMLTTETRSSSIEQATAAGVRAWLPKPFEMHTLLKETRQHIRTRADQGDAP